MRRRPDYVIEQTSRHRRDVVPTTPSSRRVQLRTHRTRRGKRTLNAVLSVAFSGQSTQISTGSRNAGRISRSTHGSAGGWSAGAASPRNADSRSSAIVLATVLRRAASIFVWTIASIFRVVIAAICPRLVCGGVIVILSPYGCSFLAARREVWLWAAWFGFLRVSGAKVEN
jgi:hypothetical protein